MTAPEQTSRQLRLQAFMDRRKEGPVDPKKIAKSFSNEFRKDKLATCDWLKKTDNAMRCASQDIGWADLIKVNRPPYDDDLTLGTLTPLV